jgi:transketolase
MRPSIRLAALSGLDPVYVFTHDSIALGEDGPTHQPVEHLAALRCIPRLTVIRPGDALECAVAWKWILQNAQGPTALVLSRQSLPILDRTQLAPADGLLRGGYVLARPEAPHAVTLVASGSELSLAVAAREELEKQGVGVSVVSLPSWEIFESQEPSYRNEVIPAGPSLCIGIEAGVRQGWDRWLGPRGVFLGMSRFGASAPGERLQEAFGFTPQHLVEMVQDYLS